jgi:hypothetical protein
MFEQKNPISIYDPQSGEFTGATYWGTTMDLVLLQVPEGMAYKKGAYDKDTHRVDLETGNVVAKT